MNTKELSKRYSVLLKRYWDIKSAREGSSVKSGDKKKEEKHLPSSKCLSAITALNRTKGLDGRRMRICPCPHPLKSSEEPWRRLCCLCAALTWPHWLVSWSHAAPPHSGLKFIYLETLEPLIISSDHTCTRLVTFSLAVTYFSQHALQDQLWLKFWYTTLLNSSRDLLLQSRRAPVTHGCKWAGVHRDSHRSVESNANTGL